MADDAKAEEMLGQLRDAFNARIRDTVRDLPPHQALQLADALCSVQIDLLAGMRVHYKAKPAVDGEAIAEDWRRGKVLAEIMRDHDCSKVTAYKYHPVKQPKRRA